MTSGLVGARTERLLGVVVHAVSCDGTPWNARWHRKGRTPAHTASRSLSWAIAVLFLGGSILFVIAGAGAFANDGWVNGMNLVGATLFSTGAIIAVAEVRSALAAQGQTASFSDLWRSPAGRAALIQLPAAVVFFQLAMIAGVVRDLSWTGTHALLWTPSTIGSIGFVVSSGIAWREARPAQDIGTAASVANLVGSAGFLFGSLTGFFDDFGLPANDIVNPVFLAGSVAFAIGSVLALAELKTPTST